VSYLEIYFGPVNNEADSSLLIAGLLLIGFESFSEKENALLAYIPADIYHERLLEESNFLMEHPGVKFKINHLEDINWNKEWESNYPPVTIAGRCHVRAPFHPPVPGMLYDIVIEPKMAFGTAHHETTQLMAGWLMELDVKEKDVLDMGCGTGVLAILANKMGASGVTGIDNDEWAWRNARENFTNNGVEPGRALLGNANMIEPGCFDLVLVNINRNVLLQDMKEYCNGLRENGLLLLSGFYRNDIEAIAGSASKTGMQLTASRSLNDWAVLLFQK
jgi:ribosomal protein L11 methyltransferase